MNHCFANPTEKLAVFLWFLIRTARTSWQKSSIFQYLNAVWRRSDETIVQFVRKSGEESARIDRFQPGFLEPFARPRNNTRLISFFGFFSVFDLLSISDMSNAPIRPRVQSGIPWWLWLLLIVLGAGVSLAVIAHFTPPDGKKFIAEARAAHKALNQIEMEKALVQLKKVPSEADQALLLEGMLVLLKSRPKLAIPILEEASKRPSVRGEALSYLASAHTKAGDRMKSIEVLRQAVADDESNTLAVSLLANTLFEVGALEEAMTYLQALIDKKAAESPTAHGVMANILFDLERYEESIPHYIGAVEGDPGSPTNGMSTLKLVQAYNKIGDFEKALKYVESAEDLPSKQAARAEALLASGDEKGAAEIAQQTKMSMGTDIQVQKVLARIALKKGKEACEQELAGLKESLRGVTRDADFYQVLTEVARAAGRDEEAAVYEQNAQQLADLKKRFTEKRAEVAKGLDDIDGRFEVADLASECGLFEQARFWYGAAARIDPIAHGQRASKGIASLYEARPELVSTEAFRPKAPIAESENPAESATSPDSPAPPNGPPGQPPLQ